MRSRRAATWLAMDCCWACCSDETRAYRAAVRVGRWDMLWDLHVERGGCRSGSLVGQAGGRLEGWWRWWEEDRQQRLISQGQQRASQTVALEALGQANRTVTAGRSDRHALALHSAASACRARQPTEPGGRRAGR